MKTNLKPSTRNQFLRFGILAMVASPFLKIFKKKKDDASEKIKMLTQDGRLVEIDKKHLSSVKNKISDNELIQWIKNKI